MPINERGYPGRIIMLLKKIILLIFVLILCPMTTAAETDSPVSAAPGVVAMEAPLGVSKADAAAPESPVVVMETSLGTIKIKLFAKEAPLSVANFLNYVNQGFYNGQIFHRVIPKFMIQGGGFEPGMKRRAPTQAPVANEATNGLKNKRGTIAMARTGQIHSATSQFFINVVDNVSLDNRGTLPYQFGYAVFGEIMEGMAVADQIVASPTTTVNDGASQFKDVPKEDILITKAYEVKP